MGTSALDALKAANEEKRPRAEPSWTKSRLAGFFEEAQPGSRDLTLEAAAAGRMAAQSA